ncbi:MAG TPA: cation:dicarboxylase symporter family transporter [Acidobacteriaceae bacterium]
MAQALNPDDELASAEAPSPRSGSGNRTWWIVAALVLGFLSGMVLHRTHYGQTAGSVAGQLGSIWLNALLMTLVPLIFCLMTIGAGSIAAMTGSGRLVATTFTVFGILLVLGCCVGAFAAIVLLHLWPVIPIPASSVSVGIAPVPASAPTLLGQIVALIPSNPVQAAAATAMTPLIIFAAIFGAAITRLEDSWRSLLTNFFQAIAAAMLVIVEWVLWWAPAGVFCLALNATASAGAAVARGVLQYMVELTAALMVALLCAVVIGVSSGFGVPRFLRALIAPLTLAASTQSSMACLPALLLAGEELGLPTPIVRAIMPLTVSLFRFGNMAASIAAGLIGAALFGVHPSAQRIVIACGLGILINFGIVGVPGQALLFAAYGPVFLALGTPIEAISLLIAVFTIPDIFNTSTNVTADLAATSLISTLQRKKAHPVEEMA